ncbi:unnamed protein product, partial [Tetraodon nigroviridis]
SNTRVVFGSSRPPKPPNLRKQPRSDELQPRATCRNPEAPYLVSGWPTASRPAWPRPRRRAGGARQAERRAEAEPAGGLAGPQPEEAPQLRPDQRPRGAPPPARRVVEDGRGLPLRPLQPALHHRGHHRGPREGPGPGAQPAAARQVLRLRGPGPLGLHRHRGQRPDPVRPLAHPVALPQAQVGGRGREGRGRQHQPRVSSRSIVGRRCFFLIGTLYLYRCATMYVTTLPVPGKHMVCAPKLYNDSMGKIWRILRLISGGGLSLTGSHLMCGDFLYSGHTVMLTLSYLFIKEYSPPWMWWYHWSCWLLSASGVVCILVAHDHYSIDVLVGYVATTRLFWWYHTMANAQVGARTHTHAHTPPASPQRCFDLCRRCAGLPPTSCRGFGGTRCSTSWSGTFRPPFRWCSPGPWLRPPSAGSTTEWWRGGGTSEPGQRHPAANFLVSLLETCWEERTVTTLSDREIARWESAC